MNKIIYRIGEISQIFSGGDRPKVCSDVRTAECSIPIFSNGLDEDGLYGYTNKAQIEGDCITVSARGANIGVVFYRDEPFLPIVRLLSIVPDRNKIDSKYLYYYFKTDKIIGTGSAQPQLTIPFFQKKKIFVYENLATQQKIANILSRYDEAIENNNKRIKLLEQMAQNLYKEWFVRFRFPGYENCEFENGIPVGWKVEKLGNFCKITDGTHDTPAQLEEGIPLVTGKAIRNGRIDFSIPYNISVEDHEKIKKRSGLKTGDILFSNIGTIGNVCLVNYDREFSVKNMIIFKPESINQSMYLFYLLNSDSIQSLFTAQTNGASQQFLGLDFMRRFKILLPSEEIIKLFGEKEVLIIQQINIFQQQNQNLAKQRDLLLPRLMSGKLEVD